MDIDTSVGMGLGYAVDVCDSLRDELNCEGYEVPDYIEDLITGGYSCFSANAGYDTQIEDTFVFIDEPFKFGLDLSKVKLELEEYLTSIGLEPCSTFGVVGGVMTY